MLYNRRVAKPPKPSEDPLVSSAFDASKHESLARAIEQLSPAEAQFFLAKLEAALKKRKLQLTGYIVAAIIWFIAMVCALAYDGLTDGFVGWAYIVPFGIVGVILWIFGKWSERVGSDFKHPDTGAKDDPKAV